MGETFLVLTALLTPAALLAFLWKEKEMLKLSLFYLITWPAFAIGAIELVSTVLG